MDIGVFKNYISDTMHRSVIAEKMSQILTPGVEILTDDLIVIKSKRKGEEF